MDADEDEKSQSPLTPNVVAYNGEITPYGSGLPGGFDSAAFDRNAFATDNTINESGVDVGASSIDSPLPGISQSTGEEDWNQPGEAEDWNEPPARQDYTKTTLNRMDNPPHGGPFLIDENGSYISDEAGNPFVVTAAQADQSTRSFGFAEGSGSTFGHGTFGDFTFGSPNNLAATAERVQRELLTRIEVLEAALKTYQDNLPPRNHNHPPELVEPDPMSSSELLIAVHVTGELRVQALQTRPEPANWRNMHPRSV